MTTEQNVARRKLSLLELASDLGNVSKACRVMGYSRQQFYEIRRNFQTYGADGLIDACPAPKSRIRTGSPPRLSKRGSRHRR
jgi:Helix-turn-helix domain